MGKKKVMAKDGEHWKRGTPGKNTVKKKQIANKEKSPTPAKRNDSDVSKVESIDEAWASATSCSQS